MLRGRGGAGAAWRGPHRDADAGPHQRGGVGTEPLVGLDERGETDVAGKRRARLEEAGIAAPEEHFVAVSAPGTRLADEARKRRFRRCFETAQDGTGPYSALFPCGLVPMALVGIDIEALLCAARRMRIGCGPEVPAAANPALHLGALLAMAARAGRDKVTFVFSEALAPFARWLDPLLAASASRSGPGLLPVDGEPLDRPRVYG